MADMKLKNCPYCNGKPSLIPHIHNKTYEVRCLNENCYEGCALHTPEEAAKHWNTRASDSTIEAQETEIKRLREAIIIKDSFLHKAAREFRKLNMIDLAEEAGNIYLLLEAQAALAGKGE